MKKPKAYKNFINGEWVKSHTGDTYQNINPADFDEVVGIFQQAPRSNVMIRPL